MAFYPNPKVVRKASGVTELFTAKNGEAAGQTYLKGQPVYLDGSSQVTEVASDGTAMMGLAQTDATGTQATEAVIEVIRPEDEVEIVCSTTVAKTNQLIKYAFVVASNVAKCDLSDTGHDAMILVRPVFDSTGAYTTKAIVSFLPAVCQALAAAG